MGASPALHKEPRVLEIETLEQFDRLVAEDAKPLRTGAGQSLSGWHFQSVDLRERSGVLRNLDPSGAIFLGCDFAPGMEEWLCSRGALLFPVLPGIPFDAYRAAVYTPAELFDGLADAEYEATPDARIYAWSTQPAARVNLDATLAASLHEHAVGDAMDALFDGPGFNGRKVVGVMGGHAAGRGSATYDDAARLGRQLANAGCAVATGGGPGPRAAPPAASLILASRPGIMGTNRQISSPRTSPSTSPIPSGRRCCWSGAMAASSSCPAPAERCRRSSRMPAKTTMRRRRSSRR